MQPVVFIGVYGIVRQHVRTVRYWNTLQRYTTTAIFRICVLPKSCNVATNPRVNSLWSILKCWNSIRRVLVGNLTGKRSHRHQMRFPLGSRLRGWYEIVRDVLAN
jgi:putative heme iron utilization protein